VKTAVIVLSAIIAMVVPIWLLWAVLDEAGVSLWASLRSWPP
jgi:hypothetical protein